MNFLQNNYFLKYFKLLNKLFKCCIFILQGFNSYFEIVFEKDGQLYYDFVFLLKEVFFEFFIFIRVNNLVDLDYEKLKIVIFDVSFIKFSLFDILFCFNYICKYGNIRKY